jgi:uncharacterized cupredoxin-like copper-binding protein
MLAAASSDRTGMRQLSFLGRLTLIVLAVSLATACSFSRTGSRARVQVVHVKESDFRIQIRPKHVRAGVVRLVVENDGPVTHELLVARRRTSGLPLRSDELTVDEHAVPTAGVVEGAHPGRVHELRLRLKPGRYQLFCNMAGHYLAGMHAELVVR